MRLKPVTAILIVVCAFALTIIPASAAPVQQQRGWTSTNYVLIDGSYPLPIVTYSDISGVQVNRQVTGYEEEYEITFARPYRFLVASVYYICPLESIYLCESTTPSSPYFIMQEKANPRKWIIATHPPLYSEVMISLIVKP